jgi:hypothetical protein
MEAIVAMIVVFSTVFGIFYLFINTRHKQRMALIEKGADASLFYNKNVRPKTIWKILLVNIALLLIGIGLGVFIGGAIHQFAGIIEEIAMPGSIFTFAGLGLFFGFRVSSKIDN